MISLKRIIGYCKTKDGKFIKLKSSPIFINEELTDKYIFEILHKEFGLNFSITATLIEKCKV